MERHCLVFIAIALVTGLVGCSRHPLDSWWPETSVLAGDLPMAAPPVEPPSDTARFSPDEFDEPQGQLTLGEVLALALTQNPELASFAWEVRAAEARALQAGLLPNPEVSVEVENIGGSGDLEGLDGAETTVALSQVFLLGKKLENRTKVAALEQELAAWDYEAKRIGVFVYSTQQFVEVLAAQRQVALAIEANALADKVHDVVSRRVDAGDASPTEMTRMSVFVFTDQIALRRAERALQAARHRLAGTWGSTTPEFESVIGQLGEVSPIPSAEALTHLVRQNPQIAKWAVEMSRRQAAIGLAKSEAVPDIEGGAGWRYFNETDDTAFVVNFSLPLPLFDGNQGGVLEARYNLAKAKQEQRYAEVRVKSALVAAYQELAAAHSEASTLHGEVLPAARRGFDAMEKAYALGNVGYLEILDTHRTLIEVQSQYIDALAAFHRGVAELEGLIGRPLSEITIHTSPQTKGDNP